MAQPRDTRQIRSDLAARAADMPRGPDGQFLPIHGAYSGRLDDDTMLDHRRADVQDYLAYRAKLVRDLTGEEEESGTWPSPRLSAQEQSIVADTAFLDAQTGAVRVYVLNKSTTRRTGRVLPVLANHYTTWVEAKRRHLETLGLARRGKTKQLADIRREGGGQ